MKTFLTCAVLACTLLFSGTSAAFAAYPDRPIKIGRAHV